MSLPLPTPAAPDRRTAGQWKRVLHRSLAPLTVTPRVGRGFTGRVSAGRLGYVRVVSLEADAARLERTAAQAARTPAATVAVAVQAGGRGTLRQDGREALVEAGRLMVCDAARPYRMDYEDAFASCVFRLPRATLAVSDAQLHAVTGRSLDSGDGVARLLAPMLLDLSSSASRYAPAVADRLAGNVADLLATLVVEVADAVEAVGETPAPTPDEARRHLLGRVRQYIGEHLDDPGLCPEAVARAHRISVRYLHLLFEGEGTTVARFIQQSRLRECRRALARGGPVRPSVAAVGQRWGFPSAAHFSRVFRAAYGMTPTQWRESGAHDW